MKVISHQMIQPQELKARNCHASQCLPLRDGSVFAVWFEGTKEGQDDVCIWGAKRTIEGVWQPKRRLTEEDGLPHWNPVLFQLDDDTIQLYFKKGKPIARWYTMVMESHDLCETFTEARELVPGDVGGRGPVRNRPLRLSNGMIAAPASDESFLWTAFADLSPDGKTWQATSKMNIFHSGEQPVRWLDRKLDHSKWRRKRGVIQPAFWEDEPGKVHALLRSSEGRIYRMDSEDYAAHWCRPYRTGLPNNNSGIDLTRLSDGRLALVYNPVGFNWGPRNPISLAISEDGGKSFQKVMDLDRAKGLCEFSYPCVCAKGNRLYITYTYNRLNIAFWEIEC